MTLRTKRSAPRDDNDDIENVEPSSSSNNKRLRINDSGTREPLQPLQVQPPSPRPPSPEQILLSKQRSEPSYWTNHRAIKMNALYGNRFLGKRIRASMRPFIERYECSEQNVYRFFYPNGRRSVPFACNYAHRAHGGQLLAVADEDRRVTLIRTDKDNTSVNEQYHESFYTHTNAVMDVKWSRDDEVLLTGSADQKIRLWDVESKTCIATLTGHSSTIRSVNFHPNHPSLIVAASREGAFRIYDMRSNTLNKRDSSPFSRGAEMYGPTKSCHNAHIETKGKKKLSSNERSVTCALFLPNEDNKVVTSGSYDGLIKIWDCRAGRDPRPLQISDFSPSGRPRGIADLKLDHAGVRLFSLRMDQTISMFNVSDITNPVSVFKDENFKTNSFFVKMAVSPDDRCIASGSSANCVNIWDINRPHDEAVIFPGARGEVSSVAWQHNQIAACSDDGAVRIWKYNHH